MAIRRCPYCKAIIDEKDKYCENCGTQLLFPEDEYEEEPIKGDKIVDDEEASEKEENEEDVLEEEAESGDKKDEDEDTEETEDEEEEETEEEAEEEDEEEDEDEEEEEEEEDDEDEDEEEKEGEEEEKEEDTGELNKFAESEKEEEETYEEELDYGREEKGEFGESEGEEREQESTERTPTRVIAEEEEKDERELQSWMALKEEIANKAQAERKDKTPQEFQEDIKKYKVSIEADELVFKTKELDQLTQTVEEGKKDIEELLLSYEEKKEEKEEKPASETKDELPPWLSGMKEVPSSITPSLEKEAAAEREPARREWAVDSGIGIPERVTQTTTSFAETVSRIEERHEEEEELAKEAAGEEEARHPRGFSLKLKAKCVDLVFITALWLISLAFAAGVIGVSFFRIILVAPLPVLAFYLLLLLLYFFLFLYFLGETLGDHYFSAED